MTPIRELPSPSPATPLFSSAPSAPARSPPRATPHPATTDEPSPFARLLRGLAKEADAGEAAVHGVLHAARARPGAPMDPASLLALQAGIYRYGETIDLAARLVDKASSSVKTVIQGQ